MGIKCGRSSTSLPIRVMFFFRVGSCTINRYLNLPDADCHREVPHKSRNEKFGKDLEGIGPLRKSKSVFKFVSARAGQLI